MWQNLFYFITYGNFGYDARASRSVELMIGSPNLEIEIMNVDFQELYSSSYSEEWT